MTLEQCRTCSASAQAGHQQSQTASQCCHEGVQQTRPCSQEGRRGTLSWARLGQLRQAEERYWQRDGPAKGNDTKDYKINQNEQLTLLSTVSGKYATNHSLGSKFYTFIVTLVPVYKIMNCNLL